VLSLNFIYFTTITKQVIQLILIMLVAPMFAFRWPSCGRKPECPEETHMSDLVTTLPAVRGECVNTAQARQPSKCYCTRCYKACRVER